MKRNIRDFAKVGLAHFMFWPACLRTTSVLVDSLCELVQRRDIEVIDCCLPYDRAARERLASVLRASGKQIGYAIHPFPLDKISLGSTMDHEQGLARLVIRDQIEAAAQVGAATFTIASGIDPGPDQRQNSKGVFAYFCRWLCPQLKARGMTALLEPFDRTIYRKFLFGPTLECVELVDSLKSEGHDLRIQLDIAHVQLSGESFDDAIRVCGNKLGHVHLGNCVMRNPSDPFHGDRHPPIGYAGGEIDDQQLTEALRSLLNSGYLDNQRRPTLVIEAQPFPGCSPEQTIDDQLARLERCWKDV